MKERGMGVEKSGSFINNMSLIILVLIRVTISVNRVCSTGSRRVLKFVSVAYVESRERAISETHYVFIKMISHTRSLSSIHIFTICCIISLCFST